MGPTGRLENWRFDANNGVLWGNLFNDTRQRWEEGAYIHTSYVKAQVFNEGDVVQTLNSSYLLGQQQQEVAQSG